MSVPLAPTHPNQTGLSALGIDRTALQRVNGGVRFRASDNGSVVRDRWFTGRITLDGVDGLTFERVWFGRSASDFYIVLAQNNARNVTFVDCDFGQPGSHRWTEQALVAFIRGQCEFRRCLLHNAADCVKVGGAATTTIENSWVQPVHVGTKHTDCVQFDDGTTGKLFAARSTFEPRSWQTSEGTCHGFEELEGAEQFHDGNSTLQTKPCDTAGGCDGPLPGMFLSFRDCIIAGGNYVGTFERQDGEFVGNTMIRGSQTFGAKLGLRNSENLLIDGNRFHDGGTYTGGTLGSGTTDPIPLLLGGDVVTGELVHRSTGDVVASTQLRVTT